MKSFISISAALACLSVSPAFALDTNLAAAINGTAASVYESGADRWHIHVDNDLDIPIRAEVVGYSGRHYPAERFTPAGKSQRINDVNVGTFIQITNELTGALIWAFRVGDEGPNIVTEEGGETGNSTPSDKLLGKMTVTIDATNFTPPNEIGLPPFPTDSLPLPPDSTRVTIESAVLDNGNYLLREQYWDLSGDSYTVAPGMKTVVRTVETVGRESISSTTQEFNIALGVTTEAAATNGWAAIGVQISTNLSYGSSSFQQYSSSQSTQVTREQTIGAPADNSGNNKVQTFLFWQLIDLVTIIEGHSCFGSVSQDHQTGCTPKTSGTVAEALAPTLATTTPSGDPAPAPDAPAHPDRLPNWGRVSDQT